MRLRTFSAPTLNAAMREVRQALGPEAIIVATQRGRNGAGVRVTAALDRDEAEHTPIPIAETGLGEAVEPVLAAALAFHGTPLVLAGRLIDDALGAGSRPAPALESALGNAFGFKPLDAGPAARRVMTVGPPGSGKTVTAAKLAARAALQGINVHVVSTDRFRAGGTAQLASLTEIMGIALHVAETAQDLKGLVDGLPRDDTVIVDTAGANPFNLAAIGKLADLAEAAGVEPVLILAAGGDVDEAADIAAAFNAVGAQRLLATRVDAARRLGGLLAAADAGKLHFAEMGDTPHIADGLRPLSPAALARLLMRTQRTTRPEENAQ